MACCLIGLGANLGDPRATLAAAVERLRQDSQINALTVSRWHDSPAAGGPPGQPPFVNAVARLTTTLAPEDLLSLLQQIEAEFGRQRGMHWAARTLDLDLLLYDQRVCETAALTLPHPRMMFRPFVLQPAVEVAGEWVHPVAGVTLAELLMHVENSPRLVALVSSCWFAKQYVAASAARILHDTGVPVQVTTARGITVLDQAPIDAAAHPLVDHVEDLAPQLIEEVQKSLAAAGSSGWVIAGFWTPELDAGAEVWFTGEAQEAVRKIFAEALADAPTPKLVVYLETPDDLLLEHESSPAVRQRQIAYRDALAKQVAKLSGVPLLKLSAAQPELAIREVTAAIVALRK